MNQQIDDFITRFFSELSRLLANQPRPEQMRLLMALTDTLLGMVHARRPLVNAVNAAPHQVRRILHEDKHVTFPAELAAEFLLLIFQDRLGIANVADHMWQLIADGTLLVSDRYAPGNPTGAVDILNRMEADITDGLDALRTELASRPANINSLSASADDFKHNLPEKK